MIIKRIRLVITLAAIACMSLLPASCTQTEPHHDTIYVWNVYTWNNEELGQKVAASADSILVDYVFLESDGTSVEGLPTTILLNRINKVIDYVTPENRYKVRGAGVLNGIWIHNKQNVQDSIALVNMGFKFGTYTDAGYQR